MVDRVITRVGLRVVQHGTCTQEGSGSKEEEVRSRQ